MPNERPHILWNNLLDSPSVLTATSALDGHPADKLIDWRPYTYWMPTSTATQYITADCGSAKAADALAIYSHDLYTRGATVSVECSSDNFAGDVTAALAPFAVTGNGAIYKTFASLSKRYWRIKIVNLTGACYIGIACLGPRLTFDRYPLDGFDPAAEEPVAEDALSTDGQLLGSVNRHVQRSFSVPFSHLGESWFTSTFKPAWDAHLGRHRPFFFVWDPTGHPTDVALVAVRAGSKLSAPMTGQTRAMALEFAGVME